MKIYLVGGAVRDELLGKKPKDFDYLVVGATIEDFFKKYPNAVKVGKSFPVFLVNNNEYAFARKEKKVSLGYRGFETYFSEKITLKEDLSRRDFTINALAKDLESGEIIDYFNGIKDLKNKRLVHITNAFKEDPLRVYRGASLMARLGDFSISNKTILLMNSLKNELYTLSKERVWIETLKGLNGKMPSKFFKTLKQADVLEIHFNFLKNISEKEFEKTMQFVDYFYWNPLLSFAFLFVFIDKTKIDIERVFFQLNLPSRFVKFTSFFLKYKDLILTKDFYKYEKMVEFLFKLSSFEQKYNSKISNCFFRSFYRLKIVSRYDYEIFIKAYELIKSYKLPEYIKNKGKETANFLKQKRVEIYKQCLKK